MKPSTRDDNGDLDEALLMIKQMIGLTENLINDNYYTKIGLNLRKKESNR
jgi:hypothetical protein